MKPSWLKIKPPAGDKFTRIKQTLSALDLHTVCTGAHCPNLAECWGNGTATFLILGDTCTRACKFCAVKKGAKGAALDEKEPENLVRAVKEFGLKYVVLTSVDRDDLKDGGASHFAKCIHELKRELPGINVEALIPDFSGDENSLRAVLSSSPDVLGHNLETVERLTPLVRDRRASYSLSLSVLKKLKQLSPAAKTKSSLMLGLGEREDEILKAMDDLRKAKVDFLTLGQYLQPSPAHLPVAEYIAPEKFAQYAAIARGKRFSGVAAGPFVRSSYRAAELFQTVEPL